MLTDPERLTKAAEMITRAKQRGAEEMLAVMNGLAYGTRDNLELVNNLASYVQGLEISDREIYLVATGYNLGMERLCEVAKEALPIIFNEEQNHAAMVDDMFAQIKRVKEEHEN